MYNWIKVFHVISAALLFGMGLASVIVKIWITRSKNIELMATVGKQISYADWVFTSTAGLFQPISGMIMVMIKGYSMAAVWVMGSIIGYLFAAMVWLPVSKIQTRTAQMAMQAFEQQTELPLHYDLYQKVGLILAVFAFSCLTAVFFLMANRPETLAQLHEYLR